MSHINWEGLLEMWQNKLAANEKYLNFVQLPTSECDKVINLYLPEHCGAEHQGNNMISNEDLQKQVQEKSGAEALLLYSCVKITNKGILSSLKILNGLSLLVLDEVKISHNMMMVIANNVKTLRAISLFSYTGDVSDVSIEAIAKANTGIEWFVLPGFSHATENWKITSQSVTKIAQNCSGLRRISLPAIFFDEHAVRSLIKFLHPEKFEELTTRRWTPKMEIDLDQLKLLFDKFPKLRAEDLTPQLMRKADVPQGFENIEIGKDERTMMSVAVFSDFLNGKHAQMVKKVSIPLKREEILKALVNKGLHNKIKELDFGIGGMDVLSKEALSLLSTFTGLESLDLSFSLGEADGCSNIVKTNDIVKLVADMKQLRKLDLSWCAISPEGVGKLVKGHPLLVDLKMEGCGGESYDYTDFLMGLEDVAVLNRPGLKWSSRNKYGERSGMYQQEARLGLEELGMETLDGCESDEDDDGDYDDDSDD